MGSSTQGASTQGASTQAKVKPRSALLPTVVEAGGILPTVVEAGEKALDDTTGILIESCRPSHESQSKFAKKSYESQVGDKEEAPPRPSQTRPARKKPMRRCSLYVKDKAVAVCGTGKAVAHIGLQRAFVVAVMHAYALVDALL